MVVSTADPFHHGIGYGDPPERSLAPDGGGLELARETIEAGIELLARGDYAGYDAHCLPGEEDARDAGQVFRYVRGELSGQILDKDLHGRVGAARGPALPGWLLPRGSGSASEPSLGGSRRLRVGLSELPRTAARTGGETWAVVMAASA